MTSFNQTETLSNKICDEFVKKRVYENRVCDLRWRHGRLLRLRAESDHDLVVSSSGLNTICRQLQELALGEALPGFSKNRQAMVAASPLRVLLRGRNLGFGDFCVSDWFPTGYRRKQNKDVSQRCLFSKA